MSLQRALADFDRMMSPDYWEVGTSGRIYDHAFLLSHLAQNPPVHATTASWRISGHALHAIAAETYLLTYTLRQGDRVTRRATLWQRTHDDWQILYHQGTLVSMADSDPA